MLDGLIDVIGCVTVSGTSHRMHDGLFCGMVGVLNQTENAAKDRSKRSCCWYFLMQDFPQSGSVRPNFDRYRWGVHTTAMILV